MLRHIVWKKLYWNTETEFVQAICRTSDWADPGKTPPFGSLSSGSILTKHVKWQHIARKTLHWNTETEFVQAITEHLTILIEVRLLPFGSSHLGQHWPNKLCGDIQLRRTTLKHWDSEFVQAICRTWPYLPSFTIWAWCSRIWKTLTTSQSYFEKYP